MKPRTNLGVMMDWDIMSDMLTKLRSIFIVTFLVVIADSACSKETGLNNKDESPTPSKGFTPADIAKLKWIEGTWRGMDGEKPFFERYRFENDTSMIVETFTDGTFSKLEDASRFELKDGEFGHTEGNRRSAASSITADAVQFVPVGNGGNSFRFERQTDGTWKAVLEWPARDAKPAGQKVYKMEPWPPQ